MIKSIKNLTAQGAKEVFFSFLLKTEEKLPMLPGSNNKNKTVTAHFLHIESVI